MNVERHLEIRAPLDALEAEVVRRALGQPDDASPAAVAALRYVLSLARLTLVRNRDGDDVDVTGLLASHAWKVRHALQAHLGPEGEGLWGATRELPELVAETRLVRARILEHLPLDRESLEEEVTTRQFVVAAGGGGGAGYGYAGAFTLFHRNNLQPALLAGTSIGAIIALFRARRRRFDIAAMFGVGRRLSWASLFRLMQSGSRYGLPASMRLHLHGVLGPAFTHPAGRTVTMQELEIPMRIVTTGIRSDALKHDLAYYEHFLDDAVRGGLSLSGSRLRSVTRVVDVIRELMADPELIQEIVFGEDAITLDADVLDAAGFSASIPGLIHYDVLREDQRMRSLLDRLYAHHGITRLVEGGLVANVPARAAYRAVMEGAVRRRNPFVVAMDCFAPSARSFLFFPLQQLVRANVIRNVGYAHLYFPLKRALNPLNLAPDLRSLEKCMAWTADELKPHVPFIREMCAPIPVLSDAA